MASKIICKLSFGDENRRFTVQTDETTYGSLHMRAKALFSFEPKTIFKLQYIDDEGDVITMSTDDEMAEAIGLALSLTPPILRVKVKMDSKSPMPPPSAAEEKAPVSAAADPPAPDLSALFKNIHAALPAVLGTNSTRDLGAVLKNVGDALPAFVDSLPPCVRAHMDNAELDVEATLKKMAATQGDTGSDGWKSNSRDISFSVLPPLGYGDKGIHPGVTCDKTGMCPIVGARYNLTGHDYDLCEAEFMKLDPSEQAKFVKIDPPFGGGLPAVHHGVTCDKSGMCPIVGARYNLKGDNYDLCEAEFHKLDAAQQTKFVKISTPACPWRPKWGRGGMASGVHYHGSNMGQGHGGAKLAARFVSDLSIFDGTQMAPGTQFTKIWRIKNVGETPWPAGTKLLFVGGDRMAAEMTVPLNESHKAVMPGEEADIAVDMVAPTDLGRYLGYWRLVGPMGRRRFGQRVWCHIQVVDPAGGVAPHDPNVVAAEISNLMAQAQENDPDADDADIDAMTPAAPADAARAAASCSSDTSHLSSVVSSTTSSAVSVHQERVSPAVAPPKDTEAAAENAVAPPGKCESMAEPKHVSERSAFHEKSSPMEENPVCTVATELLAMGFSDQELVEHVIDKNGPDIEACARDLVAATEWDEMLSDLEEMGFENKMLNKKLMVKNNGSVKRTVKDLVADVDH